MSGVKTAGFSVAERIESCEFAPHPPDLAVLGFALHISPGPRSVSALFRPEFFGDRIRGECAAVHGITFERFQKRHVPAAVGKRLHRPQALHHHHPGNISAKNVFDDKARRVPVALGLFTVQLSDEHRALGSYDDPFGGILHRLDRGILPVRHYRRQTVLADDTHIQGKDLLLTLAFHHLQRSAAGWNDEIYAPRLNIDRLRRGLC